MSSAKRDSYQENVINQLHGDKVIWAIIVLLILFSLPLIYSASSSLAAREHATNLSYLFKQLQFIGFGVLAIFICYKIPLRWYRQLSIIVFLASVILLILTPLIGIEINGAKRWIGIGSITFQPSEIAKIAIVLYLARVIEIKDLDTFKEFFITCVIPVAIVCLLVMIGSISQALLIGIVALVIFYISGIKLKFIGYTLGIACCCLIVVAILHLAFGLFPRIDTAFSRIQKFSGNIEQVEDNSMTEAERRQKLADETFQADMAKTAISSVGIVGKGPGKSTQRYVLPHPYSDYIFTIIVEEYGLIGGVLVMLLYLCFFYRCISLVKNCRTLYASLTVSGLGFLIVLQAMLHILVNVGILPVTGHTLPLISLGGSSLIILSCAFGIILSVSRTKEATIAKEKNKIMAAGNSVAGGGNEETK